MDSSKIEREADSDNCSEPEMLSISDKYSEDNERENRGGGGTETKNKMKLRSFKLSRLPSLRSCVRPMKSPSSECPGLFSGASSEQSISYARKESFQKSAGSSFKPIQSLAKMSSMKFRRPLMRKSSGGTDLKKKVKKTRSIKPASSGRSRLFTAEEHAQCDQPCESCYSSNDQNEKSSDASVRAFKRTATLRPQRILTKTASLKSKRSSMKKSSEVSEISGPSIYRATCSSTLKDAKFPHGAELQPGGSESEGISAMKVCTYSYCSLHGHRHGPHGALPPLKRFISLRRQSLKSQKSMKQESCSVPKVKHSRSRRKGAQTSQMVFNGDSTDQETAQAGREISSVTKKVFKAEFKEADGHGTENVNGTMKPVKLNPEANYAKKEEKIAASSYHDGDEKPILIADNHQIIDYGSPELKDSIQFDDPSLKHDDVISTSPKEAPVDTKVHKELNGDTLANLNFAGFKGSCELNIEVSEARTVTRVINEEKPEDSEPDNDLQEGFPQSGDSLLNCAADQSEKSYMGKPRYIGLWGLIYQHMASGIAAEDENELPHNGKEKAEQDKDRCTVAQKNNSVSDQSASGTDEGKGMGDHNAGDQKFELWQSDAIKLVQEAFDKILSEIPDQSSHDQSVTTEATSEQELLENNKREGGQQSISSYGNCTKESSVQDPEEPQLETKNINTSEEEKTAINVGNKSRQPISKNWSNLKKVIILKRFVKALEKVNKFNPRKPPILPIEADPETEKVHLRHQTVEERKNADEWMLDYALRQVISTLAPAQKRKVALLVQAFETVTPLPEISTHLRSNATAFSHSTPLQVSTDFSIQRGDQNESGLLHEPSYPEISIEGAIDHVSSLPSAEKQIPRTCSELQERSLGFSCSYTAVGPLASGTTPSNLNEEEGETATFKVVKGENNSIPPDDQQGVNDVSLTNSEESRLSGEPSSKPDNSKSTSNGRKSLLKVSEEAPLTSDSEFHDRDIKINSKRLETGNLLNAAGKQSCQPKSLSPENFMESTAVSNVLSSTAFSEPLKEPRTVCGEEANTQYEVLQKSSALEESEPSDTIDMEQQSKLEKQKYMRLWYLLYKHMVSGSTEAGTEPISEGSHREEQGSNNNALLGMKDADSCRDSLQMNHKLVDNQNANYQKIECDQIEAIKIIEEAIDEIPLPDIQDDPMDDPSVTGNMISAQKLQEKHSEDGELFIATSTGSTKDSYRESNTTKVENDKTVDPRETRLNSKNIPAPDESEEFSKSSNKSKPQVQKNWSNLKKVILLKRFIKSLEKVRKFNPREPRYLPLEPDKGAEKVHLRHQNMEDRKNAEEWMLDHALQQVVAKLTPARKRKVELLIEAFETVTPMLEVKVGQRHSPAVSPQPRLINA